MSKPLTIETKVRFRRQPGTKGRVASTGPEPSAPDPVPRIARLMALAIHFDRLIREGVVENYAELARLGGVSRARITQIMDLLNLPAAEQEALLFWTGPGAPGLKVALKGARHPHRATYRERGWVSLSLQILLPIAHSLLLEA